MSKTAETARRRSILFAGLANALGKRVDKSHLVEGSSDRISATVVGKVGRARVDYSLRGELSVGHSTTSNRSSAAKPADVVAAVLAELPDDAARAKAIDRIAKSYKGGKLPEQPKPIAEGAAALLKRLTSTTTQTKAGAVSFAVSAEE